jgi:cytochrome c biogenesis protein CcdA
MNNSNLKFKTLSKIILIMMLLFLSFPFVSAQETQDDKIIMHFFWDASCPHCSNQKPYNDLLLDEFSELEIMGYEPFKNADDRAIYFEMARARGVEPRGVPMTIIGDRVWSGFAPSLYNEMKLHIQSLIDDFDDSDNNLDDNNLNDSDDNVSNVGSDNFITIPYFGIIDLDATPLWVATILIAIMDGFNPCSLWLLLFLIGVLVLTKSRKKMLIVGLTFLFITALAYGVFISGLFSIFTYVQHIRTISYVVGIMAFIFAAVNIKDYFWYKKGISFTISDKHKPGLFSKMRNILRPDNSTAQMVGATAILALGVTLVELPCTAGLPVIWSNLVAAQGVSTTGFLGLLAIYLLLYLGIEIIILTIALITMNKLDFREKHGRILKLISGVIMLVFAYMFVFNYTAMQTLLGFFNVMILSIVIVITILLVHRFILPKFGVYIGTELKKEKSEDEEKK